MRALLKVLLIGSVITVAAPASSYALRSRVSRTLKVNESVAIHPISCRLSVQASAPGRVTVQCKGDPAERDHQRASALPYMVANQTAVIRAKSCSITVRQNTARLIRLKCLPVSSATPTPIADPTLAPATISLSTGTLVLTTNGAAMNFTVTNNSSTVAAQNIQATLPAGWSDVTQDASSCNTVVPGASCVLQFTPGASVHSQSDVQIQGSNTASVTARIEVALGATTLVSSVSSLALSVNNVGLNSQLTGTARTITVTNSGSSLAQNITASPDTALPTGTTLSTTCASLAPSASCTITITPGATASSAAGNTSPTPIVLTISGENTNSLTNSIQVLTYGSVYQGGFVFSIDDTTPNSGSIGGKVLSLVDQSPGVEWVPNTGFLNCGASSLTDGAANSAAAIAALFPTFAASQFAAGICKNTINGFSDWYLPAQCEWSYDGGGPCAAGQANINDMLTGGALGSSVFSADSIYWSSTEFSGAPVATAILAIITVAGGGGNQLGDVKDTFYQVRCVRRLS